MQTIKAKGGVFGASGGSASHDAAEDAGFDKPRKPKTAKACMTKMLKLLGARDYSTQVMREKLTKAGFPEEMVNATIQKAVDARLMDDTRYAELYIRSKASLGWGRKKIEIELEKQGIDCQGLPGYPDALFSAEDELERAIACVRAHRTTAKNERDAHYRYLMGKGYSPDICSKAVRAYYAETGL